MSAPGKAVRRRERLPGARGPVLMRLILGTNILLALKHHQSTRIITPAAMVNALKVQGGE
jgi:hypothetical protein